jgi:hypothetical protein
MTMSPFGAPISPRSRAIRVHSFLRDSGGTAHELARGSARLVRDSASSSYLPVKLSARTTSRR